MNRKENNRSNRDSIEDEFTDFDDDFDFSQVYGKNGQQKRKVEKTNSNLPFPSSEEMDLHAKMNPDTAFALVLGQLMNVLASNVQPRQQHAPSKAQILRAGRVNGIQGKGHSKSWSSKARLQAKRRPIQKQQQQQIQFRPRAAALASASSSTIEMDDTMVEAMRANCNRVSEAFRLSGERIKNNLNQTYDRFQLEQQRLSDNLVKELTTMRRSFALRLEQTMRSLESRTNSYRNGDQLNKTISKQYAE